MVTDSDLLLELQALLIEDASFSSGLWSLSEVLTYLNQRQYRFLKETRATAAWTVLGWIPGQPEGDLPADWIDTLAARWHDLVTDRYHPLAGSDSFELDHYDPQTALTVGLPLGYRRTDGDTMRLTLGPPPIAQGELELIYVSLSEALTGAGIALEIPDDWSMYLLYGVLADMLGKDGRGQDLLRARYCDQRYQEGIALAASLTDGWA